MFDVRRWSLVVETSFCIQQPTFRPHATAANPESVLIMTTTRWEASSKLVLTYVNLVNTNCDTSLRFGGPVEDRWANQWPILEMRGYPVDGRGYPAHGPGLAVPNPGGRPMANNYVTTDFHGKQADTKTTDKNTLL
jgi:hypothetical protein